MRFQKLGIETVLLGGDQSGSRELWEHYRGNRQTFALLDRRYYNLSVQAAGKEIEMSVYEPFPQDAIAEQLTQARSKKCAIVCWDLSNPDARLVVDEQLLALGKSCKFAIEPFIFLVGTKPHLPRAAGNTPEELQVFASKLGIAYLGDFSTVADEDVGERIFQQVVDLMLGMNKARIPLQDAKARAEVLGKYRTPMFIDYAAFQANPVVLSPSPKSKNVTKQRIYCFGDVETACGFHRAVKTLKQDDVGILTQKIESSTGGVLQNFQLTYALGDPGSCVVGANDAVVVLINARNHPRDYLSHLSGVIHQLKARLKGSDSLNVIFLVNRPISELELPAAPSFGKRLFYVDFAQGHQTLVQMLVTLRDAQLASSGAQPAAVKPGRRPPLEPLSLAVLNAIYLELGQLTQQQREGAEEARAAQVVESDEQPPLRVQAADGGLFARQSDDDEVGVQDDSLSVTSPQS